jgi:hypothetical protein
VDHEGVDVAVRTDSNLERTFVYSVLDRWKSTVDESSDSEELERIDIHHGGHVLPCRQAREQVGEYHIEVDKVRHPRR